MYDENKMVGLIMNECFNKLHTARKAIELFRTCYQTEGMKIETYLELDLEEYKFTVFNILVSDTNPNGICKNGEIRNDKHYTLIPTAQDFDSLKIQIEVLLRKVWPND